MNRHARILLLIATLVPAAAAAAPGAHQHGAVRLAVAIDGNELSLQLEAPLDSLLGFERAPRNDAERRAASDLLKQLRSGPATLFKADPAAQCVLVKAEVQAAVLEPAGQAAPKDDEHADLDASYTFQCAQPGQLRAMDVVLFDAFKRLRRIDVQVAGPKGQRKLTLDRPARRIELQR